MVLIVFRSCHSISSIKRYERKKWSLISRYSKKNSLSHWFQTGKKSYWHLKEHCETGRDSLKTEFFESYTHQFMRLASYRKSLKQKKISIETWRLRIIGLALAHKMSEKQTVPCPNSVGCPLSIMVQKKALKLLISMRFWV